MNWPIELYYAGAAIDAALVLAILILINLKHRKP
jgi:hypothetical protein